MYCYCNIVSCNVNYKDCFNRNKMCEVFMLWSLKFELASLEPAFHNFDNILNAKLYNTITFNMLALSWSPIVV